MEDNKYQAGKIYRITDNGYHSFYYGSTIESLSRRMGSHRRSYSDYKSGKYHYTTVFSIFDEYGVDNCKIELVENFPCSNREELHKREGHHIQNNDCVNKYVAGRSNKEWYEATQESRRAYRENTKDRRREYCKARYEACKDKRIQQVKERYESDRDRILEYKKEKILCSLCNATYTISHKTRHEKSQQHMNCVK